MFRLGHVQPEEVVRDGRGGDFSTPWLLGDGITLRICTTDIFRDGTHGLELHDIGHPHDDAVLTQRTYQTDRLDRVAAKRKEGVEGSYRIADVQYSRKATGYGVLSLVGWFHVKLR